jgi:very-short-patch-repair endonuclease
VIEGFIADFYCEQSQVVVEVDGGIHGDAEVQKYDAHRETVLKARGIITIRFPNDQVCKDVESVMDSIIVVCTKNRKQSKLAEWERSRLTDSTSPLYSGEGLG